jgi:hypothetical protein
LCVSAFFTARGIVAAGQNAPDLQGALLHLFEARSGVANTFATDVKSPVWRRCVQVLSCDGFPMAEFGERI